MRISDWSSDVCSSDLASASSKTAIGLGYSIAQRGEPRPETVGLTSTAHVAALDAQRVYDRVISYDQIMTLNAATPSALVDMAGNGAVTRVAHSHFGNELKASIIVGKARSEEHTSELQSLMRNSD